MAAKWQDKVADGLRAAQLMLDAGLYDAAVMQAAGVMQVAAAAMLEAEGMMPSVASASAVARAFGVHLVETGQVPPVLHRHLVAAGRLRGRAESLHARCGEEEARLVTGHAAEFVKHALVGVVRPASGLA